MSGMAEANMDEDVPTYPYGAEWKRRAKRPRSVTSAR